MSALNELVAPNVNTTDLFKPHSFCRSLAAPFGQREKCWYQIVLNRALQGTVAKMTPFERRQLVSWRVLRPTDQLKYNVKGISRELRKMTASSAGGQATVFDLTGLSDASTDEPSQVDASGSTGTAPKVKESGIGVAVKVGEENGSALPTTRDEESGSAYYAPENAEELLTAGIDRVARELARIAEVDREFVRLTIEGSLRSAALRVPLTGYAVRENASEVLCENGLRVSRAEVLDTLEVVARYHLAECLYMAADDAHARFFEFTGFDYLDYNGGATTTNGCILKGVGAQMSSIDMVLKLHTLKAFVPANHPDVKRLERDETLVANARRLEAALAQLHGGKSEEQIRRLLRRLKREINEIRRKLGTLQGDPAFRQKAAWTNRAVDPLQMLALVTSFSQGWLSTDRDAANLKASFAEHTTRIRQAFEQAAAGIAEATMHDRRDGEQARRLFFVLRNTQTQDPKSEAARLFRKKPELKCLLNAFHEVEKAEAAKHAGLEPWSNSFLAPGIAAYEFARVAKDARSQAFVCEAEGVFTFRMQW